MGGGLSGLTAADALHGAGRSVSVVEARSSVGGRIRTIDAGLDLGATWHWSNQARIRELAAGLGMESFPQFRDGRAVVEESAGTRARHVDLPPASPAELRFVGGTQSICRHLAARLPEGAVLLDAEVTMVSADGDGVTVTVATGAGDESHLRCQAVVVAVPPRLVSSGITFVPSLPQSLVEVMQGTPTWMATAVKCVAVYESAFWRAAGLSGLAFSREGPLIEVHDACSPDGDTAALWGFLSADHRFRDLTPDERVEPVLAQLGRLFGPQAGDPIRYVERDWSDDPYTNDEVVWVAEPLASGDPALARPALGGRVCWAGSETADAGAGHMEGAVRAGMRAAAQVLALG